MGRPFVLAQISDPHIGADWGQGDPVAGLEAAVASLGALPSPPDAVLVSGDLVDHGADAEYEQARALLAPLAAPVHVLPGNHDDRGALRRHFGAPGADEDPVQYAVDLGPVRLVALDTTRPGEDPGELDAGRLEWLDAALAAAPDAPTILAMHHPPLVTGVPAWDRFGLAAGGRRALAALVARHRQVRRIVAGHVHRTMTGELAGRPVVTVPSTYLQVRLDLEAPEIALADEPPGFGLHTVLDGDVVSHVQPVR